VKAISKHILLHYALAMADWLLHHDTCEKCEQLGCCDRGRELRKCAMSAARMSRENAGKKVKASG